MTLETEAKMIEALERIAAANERLIELATEERDANDIGGSPPVCPNCGVTNPRVFMQDAEGALGDFMLVARCGSCNQRFVGIPTGMNYMTKDQAIRRQG